MGKTSSVSEFNGGVETFYRIEIYSVLAKLSAFPRRWVYGKCVIILGNILGNIGHIWPQKSLKLSFLGQKLVFAAEICSMPVVSGNKMEYKIIF